MARLAMARLRRLSHAARRGFEAAKGNRLTELSDLVLLLDHHASMAEIHFPELLRTVLHEYHNKCLGPWYIKSLNQRPFRTKV
jgi:hypothetical protein